ncbi:hypothetical protein Ancab_001265 [Ancistrocladus abbreviatus]
MVELGPHLPSSMAEEEDSKRKRSVEYGGGDRFAIESSMKDCFDDSETKPKLILKLKLSAPKVKRRRQYAYSEQGPLYELVNPGFCNPWHYRSTFYHANFEAKPIDTPDSETQIFFVEIEDSYYKDPRYVVHLCCPVEKLPPDQMKACGIFDP